MSAEIADWLGDLRDADPAALLAVMDADDVAALAFVTSTHDAGGQDPRARLDAAYRRMLTALQQVRRQCARTATGRKQFELRLGEERAAAEPKRAVVAKLEQKLAAARRREELLTGQSQRLQIAVDAFRTQKEVAKAVVTATRAQQSIRDSLQAAGIEHDDLGAEPNASQAAAKADEELAHADRLLQSLTAAAGLPERSAVARTADLEVLELRADPLGADIRILVAIEPPGTVTLLAVLEGRKAISEHRDEAIELAGDLLAEIRDHGWSSDSSDAAAGGPQFAETGAFLERCFPDKASAIAERAAGLAAAVSLRSLRGERDLAEMAGPAGIDEDALRTTEHDGLREASVHDVAAYIRALGGRLEVTAVINGERHVLAPTPIHE